MKEKTLCELTWMILPPDGYWFSVPDGKPIETDISKHSDHEPIFLKHDRVTVGIPPGHSHCIKFPSGRRLFVHREEPKEFTVFKPPNFTFSIKDHPEAREALVECLTNGNQCCWDCQIVEVNHTGAVTVTFIGPPYPVVRKEEFDINMFCKRVMDLRRSNRQATKLKLSPLLFAQLSNWSQERGFESPFGMYSLEGQQVFGLKIHEDLEIDTMGVE